MKNIDFSKIDIILKRLRGPIDTYCWIQKSFWVCDVSKDRNFQRRFNAFYRVAFRSSDWYSHFYDLMEQAKKKRISFSIALKELRLKTGKLEKSFVSKMIATVDPDKPVIDRFVSEYFGLVWPAYGSKDREKSIVKVYKDLCKKYEILMKGDGKKICKRFASFYPDKVNEISDLKKVDFVLWQMRSNPFKNKKLIKDE